MKCQFYSNPSSTTTTTRSSTSTLTTVEASLEDIRSGVDEAWGKVVEQRNKLVSLLQDSSLPLPPSTVQALNQILTNLEKMGSLMASIARSLGSGRLILSVQLISQTVLRSMESFGNTILWWMLLLYSSKIKKSNSMWPSFDFSFVFQVSWTEIECWDWVLICRGGKSTGICWGDIFGFLQDWCIFFIQFSR